MTRVELGWIGGAGRQPSALSARRVAPSGSCGPSSSTSGSMRRCEMRPATLRQLVANGVREGAQLIGRPASAERATRGVGEAPRQRPRSADEDLRPDACPVRQDAARRPAVDGLDPGPAGQSGDRSPDRWLSTSASQASGSVGGRHAARGRRSASTMIATIERSSSIRKASADVDEDRPEARRRPRR